MSKTMFALAVAVLISLPSAVVAQVYPNVPAPVPPGAAPQRPSPRQVFNWLDTNHDGFLSLNEFLAAPWIKNKQRAARFFSWMDTNKDGRVSLEEFLAAYARYCGDGGYWIRTAYPWAWTCWRPWRYGWYWQNGWHRRPAHGGDMPVIAHPRVAAFVSSRQACRAGLASSFGQARQAAEIRASWPSQRAWPWPRPWSCPWPCTVTCAPPLNPRRVGQCRASPWWISQTERSLGISRNRTSSFCARQDGPGWARASDCREGGGNSLDNCQVADQAFRIR